MVSKHFRFMGYFGKYLKIFHILTFGHLEVSLILSTNAYTNIDAHTAHKHACSNFVGIFKMLLLHLRRHQQTPIYNY